MALIVNGTTLSTESLKHDLSTLALRQAIGDNQVAYNLTNSFIDQFEDATGIGSETTVGLASVDGYVATGGIAEVQYWASATSGTWKVSPIYTTAEILIVAGGSCGSRSPNVPGGGGGAGGAVYRASYTFSATDKSNGLAYTVGAGGESVGMVPHKYDGGWYAGGNSTLGVSGPGTITATGGAGGGGYIFLSTGGYYAAGAGGCGGGGAWNGNSGGATNQASFSGWTSYGNAGGANSSGSQTSTSAGGGGIGTAGGTASTGVGGTGGNGREFASFAHPGNLQGWFGGGGGGGCTVKAGRGGIGGGAAGGTDTPTNQMPDTSVAMVQDGGDAIHGTGGGGGGNYPGGYTNFTIRSGHGGDGFIGIKYVTSFNATGTLIGTANVPTSAQTKVSGVMTYKDAAGTATIGTDLKIYFTCDGGSNWTEAASYTAVGPVFSTGIKMLKLGETTCTSGSDVRYKAVWANQASGSKETQLHGIGFSY